MTTHEEPQKMDGTKDNKVSQIELIKKTAYRMMGRDYGEEGWTAFPAKIIIQKHFTADPLYYELIDGNILRRISPRTIAAYVFRYWQLCPATVTQRLTHEHAKSVIDALYSFSQSFDEPISPVLFKSDFGYCFHRLPFDPKSSLTPTFDEMMSRTSNAKALMAWIGSLFDEKSEKQQYLWVFGSGMNGKSSLANFLHELFKDSATATQPPRPGDKFWSSQFLGRRLAIFPDCNDYTFINSGLFKSLTGEDGIRIEEKGLGAYSVKLDTKFLILSNQKPSIEGEASAVRRSIYCEMVPIKKKRMPAASYLNLLRSEASAFIAQCLDCYKSLAPDGGSIETDAEITNELVMAAEERWAFIANRHLLTHEEGTLDHLNYNEMPYVTRHYMRSIQKMENLSTGQYQSFLNYLTRTHGIIVHKVKTKVTGSIYVYIKCAPRGACHYADVVENGRPVVPHN